MTALEFQYRLSLELANYNELIMAGLTSEKMEYFINSSIDEIFDEYYDAFQKSEVTRFGIDSLVIRDTLNNSNMVPSLQRNPNGIIFKLPEGVYYTAKEYAMYDGNFIKIKPITYDFYNTNIGNTRRKPYSELFWRLDLSDSDTTTHRLHREIIHDGSVTDNTKMAYHYTYIKRPEKINIETNNSIDLGYKPSKEVVTRAAKLIYAYFKDEKGFQFKQAEQQENQDIQ